jgi:hypothetical protein
MDLTGDDAEVFEEGDGFPGFASNPSPRMEEAKINSLSPEGAPNMSLSSTASRSDASDAPRLATASLQNKDTPVTGTEVTPFESPESPVSETPRPKTPLSRPPFASTFSTISTIASVEPRQSVVVCSPLDDIDRDSLSTTPAAKPTTTKQVDVDHTAGRDLDRSGETTSQRHISPPDAVLTSQQKHVPEQETLESELIDRDQILRSNQSATNTTTTGSTDEIEENTEKPFASGVAAESQITSTAQPYSRDTTTPTPQGSTHIETTPDSLHSIDFVDPSRSFGVKARDFATMPSKLALASVPEDGEPNNKTKSRRPGADPNDRRTVSHDSSRSKFGKSSGLLYKSTFDEGEFAQKQADARAALIRLQQSLNENFLLQPPPDKGERPSGPRHSSSFSDSGKPVAPSSIFKYSGLDLTDEDVSEPHRQNAESGRKSANSYHNLTTVVEPSTRRTKTSENVSTSTKHGKDVGKGKQRANVDLNGPGPSIMEDTGEKPLPLPPPLRIKGQMSQRQHQAVPASPGEISLSNFPIPFASPRQSGQSETSTKPAPESPSPYVRSHSKQSSTGSRMLRRQSSQRSQASSASVFSIPHHMIPDRSSSIRDRSVMEVSDE